MIIEPPCRYNLLLILTLISMRSVICTAGSNGATIGKVECLQLCNETIFRVNEFLDVHGFAPKIQVPRDLSFTYKSETKYPEEYPEPLAILGGPSENLEIKVLVGSRKIVEFVNWGAFSAEQAPLYDEKPKPGWTFEKAISIAQDFARVVLREVPEALRLDYARFIYNMERKKYHAGHWYIRLSRTDASGHEFLRDAVVVMVNETQGPRSVSVHLSSNYTEPRTEPIAKVTAIQKARKPAGEIMNWSFNKMTYLKHVFVGDPKAELKVVNPNHLTRYKSVEETIEAWDRNARLAWVVSFKTKYNGPPDKDGPWLGEREVRVWIDAETGEFLGGDFD
jgi:hypothetical protein